MTIPNLEELERIAKAFHAVRLKAKSIGVSIGEINAARQAYDDVSQPETVLALIAEVKRLNDVVGDLLDHCPDAECEECGKAVCHHGEPLHFHHDGCPACDGDAAGKENHDA